MHKKPSFIFVAYSKQMGFNVLSHSKSECSQMKLTSHGKSRPSPSMTSVSCGPRTTVGGAKTRSMAAGAVLIPAIDCAEHSYLPASEACTSDISKLPKSTVDNLKIKKMYQLILCGMLTMFDASDWLCKLSEIHFFCKLNQHYCYRNEKYVPRFEKVKEVFFRKIWTKSRPSIQLQSLKNDLSFRTYNNCPMSIPPNVTDMVYLRNGSIVTNYSTSI